MRLIDADELIAEYYRTMDELLKSTATNMSNEALSLLCGCSLAVNAPTIDLVRCGECEYWQDNNGGYPDPNCRWVEIETPDADDFCSYGERRTDE